MSVLKKYSSQVISAASILMLATDSYARNGGSGTGDGYPTEEELKKYQHELLDQVPVEAELMKAINKLRTNWPELGRCASAIVQGFSDRNATVNFKNRFTIERYFSDKSSESNVARVYYSNEVSDYLVYDKTYWSPIFGEFCKSVPNFVRLTVWDGFYKLPTVSIHWRENSQLKVVLHELVHVLIKSNDESKTVLMTDLLMKIVMNNKLNSSEAAMLFGYSPESFNSKFKSERGIYASPDNIEGLYRQDVWPQYFKDQPIHYRGQLKDFVNLDYYRSVFRADGLPVPSYSWNLRKQFADRYLEKAIVNGDTIYRPHDRLLPYFPASSGYLLDELLEADRPNNSNDYLNNCPSEAIDPRYTGIYQLNTCKAEAEIIKLFDQYIAKTQNKIDLKVTFVLTAADSTPLSPIVSKYPDQGHVSQSVTVDPYAFISDFYDKMLVDLPWFDGSIDNSNVNIPGSWLASHLPSFEAVAELWRSKSLLFSEFSKKDTVTYTLHYTRLILLAHVRNKYLSTISEIPTQKLIDGFEVGPLRLQFSSYYPADSNVNKQALSLGDFNSCRRYLAPKEDVVRISLDNHSQKGVFFNLPCEGFFGAKHATAKDDGTGFWYADTAAQEKLKLRIKLDPITR